jgi:hypothetical protein
VAHVGREAGLALDALEQGVGHPVERRRQGGEVGIVGGHQAHVEVTTGDGLGCLRHLVQGTQGPTAGPATDDGAGRGGDQSGTG